MAEVAGADTSDDGPNAMTVGRLCVTNLELARSPAIVVTDRPEFRFRADRTARIAAATMPTVTSATPPINTIDDTPALDLPLPAPPPDDTASPLAADPTFTFPLLSTLATPLPLPDDDPTPEPTPPVAPADNDPLAPPFTTPTLDSDAAPDVDVTANALTVVGALHDAVNAIDDSDVDVHDAESSNVPSGVTTPVRVTLYSCVPTATITDTPSPNGDAAITGALFNTALAAIVYSDTSVAAQLPPTTCVAVLMVYRYGVVEPVKYMMVVASTNANACATSADGRLQYSDDAPVALLMRVMAWTDLKFSPMTLAPVMAYMTPAHVTCRPASATDTASHISP